MARKLNCFVAVVDATATTLEVRGYDFGASALSKLRSTLRIPHATTPVVLHTEALAGQVDYHDWSSRIDDAGYIRDGYPFHKNGDVWLMILAEQQPAVA